MPANIAIPPSRGVGIACTSRSRTAVMAPQRSAHHRASGVIRYATVAEMSSASR